MPVDKSWMQKSRSTMEYFNGVKSFLDYAYRHVQCEDMKIFCPCVKCYNRYRLLRNEVHEHILYKGIVRTYTTWYSHGENGESDSDSDSDSDGNEDSDNENDQCDDVHKPTEDCLKGSKTDAAKFVKLLAEEKMDSWSSTATSQDHKEFAHNHIVEKEAKDVRNLSGRDNNKRPRVDQADDLNLASDNTEEELRLLPGEALEGMKELQECEGVELLSGLHHAKKPLLWTMLQPL